MLRHLTPLTAAAALVVGGFVPAPAQAAGGTCHGLPVTMTVTARSGSVLGTGGDDVIDVEPASGDTGIPAPGPRPLAVFGQGGDDSICLGPGAVDVYGGPGDDYLDATGDTVSTSSEDDRVLDGGPGNDVIIGGDAWELIYGDSGDDQISGHGGNDVISEGTGTVGDDIVDGGSGTDTVDFSMLDHGIVLDLATGIDAGFGNDTFSRIDSWNGTPYDDTMTGGPDDDTLFGGSGGNDTIDGGGGNDYLGGHCADDTSGHCSTLGGEGDDVIGTDASPVDAGPGDDLVYVNGPAAVDLGSGADRAKVEGYAVWSHGAVVHGGPGNDVLLPREGLRTRSTPDRLFGGPGHDLLRPTPAIDVRSPVVVTFDVAHGMATYTGRRPAWFRFRGMDTIHGTRLRDLMLGGPRSEHLLGGKDDDVLRGGGGADLLDGQDGHDTAYGGPGRDRCLAEVRHGCEAS